MSKIALTPNASGTGTLTIAAPNTNTDRTLTLPDEAGTVLVNGTNQNVGIGTSSPTLNTNGTVLHINDSGASRAAIAHFTTAASGSGAADGLIVGKWSDDTNYIFDYDSNPIVFGVNSGEAMRIDASRNLLVGKTSAAVTGAGLWLYNDGGNYGRINYGTNITGTSFPAVFYNNSGSSVGSITYTTTSTAYNTSSDYRLKENVQPMTGALDTVAQLNPVTYTWKADGSAGQGFIAHELQAVVPDCVTGEKDAVDAEGNPKYQGVDTSFLVATLVKAIQEQQAQIEDLKAEIAALKGASA